MLEFRTHGPEVDLSAHLNIIKYACTGGLHALAAMSLYEPFALVLHFLAWRIGPASLSKTLHPLADSRK